MPLLQPHRASLTTRFSILVGVLTAVAVAAFLVTLMLILCRKGSRQVQISATVTPRAEASNDQPTLPPAYTYLQPSSATDHTRAYPATSPRLPESSASAGPPTSLAPSRPSTSSYASKSKLWVPPASNVAPGPPWKPVPLPLGAQESLATLPSTWSYSTLASPALGAQKLSQEHRPLIRSQRSSFIATSESGTFTLGRPHVNLPIRQPQHIDLQTTSQAQGAVMNHSPAVGPSTNKRGCTDPTCSLHTIRPRSSSLPARNDAPCSLGHTPPQSSTSTLTTVGESTVVEQQEWHVTTNTTTEKIGETEVEGEASVDSFVAVMLKRCSNIREGNQSFDKHTEREMQGYKDGIVDANQRLAAVFEALGLGKVDLPQSRHAAAVQTPA